MICLAVDLLQCVLYKHSMVSCSGQVVSQPVAEAAAEGDSLICQAIINSGIALETEAAEAAEQAEAHSPKEDLPNPETESRVPEIQVTEECVEVEAETVVSEKLVTEIQALCFFTRKVDIAQNLESQEIEIFYRLKSCIFLTI